MNLLCTCSNLPIVTAPLREKPRHINPGDDHDFPIWDTYAWKFLRYLFSLFILHDVYFFSQEHQNTMMDCIGFAMPGDRASSVRENFSKFPD